MGKDEYILNIEDLGDLKPCVPMFGPINLKNLTPGETKLYCRCGLSKDSPWCDNSHKGTPFKPMKWKVPEINSNSSIVCNRFSICHCKYTKKPPFCDGTHYDLPIPFLKAHKKCNEDHDKITKICHHCGYTPGLELSLEDD
ncbi:hypothetical protein K502DRAFT_289493 [Neoconidiobolus thromboides FSU 785]|nr:hypothetical protein K502DRAFT_289493 [Neoconidiobolus thromboides FSU 785]